MLLLPPPPPPTPPTLAGGGGVTVLPPPVPRVASPPSARPAVSFVRSAAVAPLLFSRDATAADAGTAADAVAVGPGCVAPPPLDCAAAAPAAAPAAAAAADGAAADGAAADGAGADAVAAGGRIDPTPIRAFKSAVAFFAETGTVTLSPVVVAVDLTLTAPVVAGVAGFAPPPIPSIPLSIAPAAAAVEDVACPGAAGGGGGGGGGRESAVPPPPLPMPMPMPRAPLSAEVLAALTPLLLLLPALLVLVLAVAVIPLAAVAGGCFCCCCFCCCGCCGGCCCCLAAGAFWRRMEVTLGVVAVAAAAPCPAVFWKTGAQGRTGIRARVNRLSRRVNDERVWLSQAEGGGGSARLEGPKPQASMGDQHNNTAGLQQ